MQGNSTQWEPKFMSIKVLWVSAPWLCGMHYGLFDGHNGPAFEPCPAVL